MCQHYILASAIEKIKNSFNIQALNLIAWESPIVVHPGSQSLIITQQNPTELTLSDFGMTPSWVRQPMNLVNARAEGDKNPNNNPDFKGSKAIFLKPSYRKLLFHQRCIVIADAFIAWSSGVLPQPHLFFLKEHRHPIGIAGLYDIWQDKSTGEKLHSFTIITIAANSLVRKLPAQRMPVILPYKFEMRWLNPGLTLMEILRFLDKHPSKDMNAYPVSSKINQPGPYNKEILKPAGNVLSPEIITPPIPRQSYYGHKHKEANGHWLGNNPI